MAKAADFDGKANETEVVTSESVKEKRKTSILGTKARLWLITINNPQNHGISLEQAEILERFKEDIASGAVTYVSSVMERSLTTDENGKHKEQTFFCSPASLWHDAVECSRVWRAFYNYQTHFFGTDRYSFLAGHSPANHCCFKRAVLRWSFCRRQ